VAYTEVGEKHHRIIPVLTTSILSSFLLAVHRIFESQYSGQFVTAHQGPATLVGTFLLLHPEPKKHIRHIRDWPIVSSKMTQVLIEGYCLIKHVAHLMISWIGIENQNQVSHC